MKKYNIKSIIFLIIIFLCSPFFQVNAEEFQTRGLARSYTKAVRKVVKKLDKQLDKSKKYVITVAGFHPTNGRNLILSSIIEAELVKEFSSNNHFQVAFYKDNAEAMKIIQFSQTAYFDKAIKLGKFISADYLVTGQYSLKKRKVHLIVTIQDLKKNLKLAGEDIDIRTSSLPKDALNPIPIKPKPMDESLEELLGDIQVTSVSKPKVLIGNFTYADSNVPSNFGVYLKDKIQNVMVQSGRFSVLSDEKTNELNRNNKFNTSQSMRGLGISKKVNLFMNGKYWDEGGKVGVSLMLKDNYDQILQSREVEINKNSIPSNLEIKPSDLDKIKQQMASFDAFDNSSTPNETSSKNDSNPISIKVWPDKGDGAVYKKGDKVYFHFKANHDCYIVLIHTDKTGHIQFLFPNKFANDNFISKNQLYVIPDKHYGFNIDVQPPYGFEMIKAIASKTQFPEIKKINWKNTKDSFLESSLKKLLATSKSQVIATDKCTFTTIEK